MEMARVIGDRLAPASADLPQMERGGMETLAKDALMRMIGTGQPGTVDD